MGKVEATHVWKCCQQSRMEYFKATTQCISFRLISSDTLLLRSLELLIINEKKFCRQVLLRNILLNIMKHVSSGEILLECFIYSLKKKKNLGILQRGMQLGAFPVFT